MVTVDAELSDELYARVNTIAVANGWSFDETMQRAAEFLIEQCEGVEKLNNERRTLGPDEI